MLANAKTLAERLRSISAWSIVTMLALCLQAPGIAQSNVSVVTTPASANQAATAIPAPLKRDTYSAGALFSPAANTFTDVFNARQVDLPYSSTVPVGSVIGIRISSSSPITIVAGEGTGEESIVLNNRLSNGYITLKPGEEICLVNKGGGIWSAGKFVTPARCKCHGSHY